MKVSHILTVLAAAGMAFAPISEALAVTITSSGIWSAGTLESGAAPAGLGSDTISWGTPFPAENPDGLQSGYVFEGNGGVEVDDADLFLNGASFKIGTFTHNNFTITGDTLDNANLSVDLQFDGSAPTTFNFGFSHNETPNDASPCAIPGTTNPCPDQVSIPSLLSTETVELAGSEFNLEVVGFLTDDSDPSSMVEAFTTLESQANSAWIIGQLTPIPGAPPPQVPLDM